MALVNRKVGERISFQSERVGLLSKYERSLKVERYLMKKQRRKWMKKINYHSRKRVADTRPRFKGRFVSVTQAGPLMEEYRLEMAEKGRKERLFAIQTFSRDQSRVVRTVFPNVESLEKSFVPELIDSVVTNHPSDSN